jgi:peptidyl-prolyl cis-trans isomerase C
MILTKYRFSNTLIVLLFMVIITAGCKPQLQTTTEPLVTIDVPTSTPLEPSPTTEVMAIRVNGDGISQVEFDQEIQRYQDGLSKAGITLPDATEQTDQVKLELTNQLLLKQGAIEKGYAVTQEAIQARLDKLVSNLGGMDGLTAWQQANFYTEETFTIAFERSIYATWMRDEIIANVPTSADQVHIRQIRVQSEGAARSVIAEIEAGSDFATLALQYDPITNGDLGWFPRGYLTQPAVDDAAFSLETGDISQVIQTDIGFHIIQVIEKDNNHELTPDALLFMQKQAITNWLEQKRNASEIVVNN